MSKYLSVTDLFDQIIDDINNLSMGDYSKKQGPNRLTEFVPSYPPMNLLLDSNDSLIFEFALAGINIENISILFSADKMRMEVDTSESSTESRFLYKGIASRKIKNEYFLPSSKYDVDNAKSSFVDGVLTIKVPVRESAKPRRLEIGTDLIN